MTRRAAAGGMHTHVLMPGDQGGYRAGQFWVNRCEPAEGLVEQAGQVGDECSAAGTVIGVDASQVAMVESSGLVGAHVECGQISISAAQCFHRGASGQVGRSQCLPLGLCNSVAAPSPGRRGRRCPAFDNGVVGKVRILSLASVAQKDVNELAIGNSEEFRNLVRDGRGAWLSTVACSEQGWAVPPLPHLMRWHPEDVGIDSAVQEDRVDGVSVPVRVHGAPHALRERNVDLPNHARGWRVGAAVLLRSCEGDYPLAATLACASSAVESAAVLRSAAMFRASTAAVPCEWPRLWKAAGGEGTPSAPLTSCAVTLLPPSPLPLPGSGPRTVAWRRSADVRRNDSTCHPNARLRALTASRDRCWGNKASSLGRGGVSGRAALGTCRFGATDCIQVPVLPREAAAGVAYAQHGQAE